MKCKPDRGTGTLFPVHCFKQSSTFWQDSFA